MVPPLPSKAKLCGRPGDRASLLALGPEDSLSRGHRRARLRAARPPPGHRPQNGRSSASRGRRCRRPREPDRRNSSRCLSLDKIRSDGWSNTNTRSVPPMLDVPKACNRSGQRDAGPVSRALLRVPNRTPAFSLGDREDERPRLRRAADVAVVETTDESRATMRPCAGGSTARGSGASFSRAR